MLVVGTNSYCTLEEANEYIDTHFVSDSIESEIWGRLSDKDKEVYLIDSADSLNGLNYKGRKRVSGQALVFPRMNYMMPGIIQLPIVCNQFADMTLISGLGRDDGLEMAKEAQIENAVAHSLIGSRVINDTRTRVLSGLSSESAGSVSKSYNNNIGNVKSSMMLKGIYNPDKVEAKLKAWLTSSIFSI